MDTQTVNSTKTVREVSEPILERPKKRTWITKNPETIERRRKKWRKYNKRARRLHRKEKNLFAKIRYRIMEAAKLGQRYDHEAWLKKVLKLNWRCFYCKKKLTNKTLTLDHIIPVTRGGTWNLENLVPACKPCNSSKGNRPLGEFLADLAWKRGDIQTWAEFQVQHQKGATKFAYSAGELKPKLRKGDRHGRGLFQLQHSQRLRHAKRSPRVLGWH